jgi:hypothetical protein
MIQSGSCQQDKAAYRRAKLAAVFFSMGNFSKMAWRTEAAIRPKP